MLVFLATILSLLLQLVGKAFKNIGLMTMQSLLLVNFNTRGQTLLFLSLIPLFFLVLLRLGLLRILFYNLRVII